MPQEYCKTVSQSCVSQGKVGGKCLQQPVPNQGTQQQSRSDMECWRWRAGGFQERERQGQATLCLSFQKLGSTSCQGTWPASDSVCTKARENCPARSHVSRHVGSPHKDWYPAKTHSKMRRKT